MPYIKKTDREKYERSLDSLVRHLPEDITTLAGEFNYVVSSLAKRYINKHGEKYARYQALLGAMDLAKMEVYRRFVLPYEDECIRKNGDIK